MCMLTSVNFLDFSPLYLSQLVLSLNLVHANSSWSTASQLVTGIPPLSANCTASAVPTELPPLTPSMVETACLFMQETTKSTNTYAST